MAKLLSLPFFIAHTRTTVTVERREGPEPTSTSPGDEENARGWGVLVTNEGILGQPVRTKYVASNSVQCHPPAASQQMDLFLSLQACELGQGTRERRPSRAHSKEKKPGRRTGAGYNIYDKVTHDWFEVVGKELQNPAISGRELSIIWDETGGLC